MPDFEIFWGEWGHIELKHELDRSSGTFFLSGGSLRPVVGDEVGPVQRLPEVILFNEDPLLFG